MLLGGNKTSTFTRNNKQYDVIVQLDPRARATPSDMTGLYVRGRGGRAGQARGAGQREGRAWARGSSTTSTGCASSTLTASLAPGFTLGEALDSLNRIADEVLPKGSSTALAGESRELEESGSSLYFAFLLALVVVFMVLASQFESLVHPFTVLLAVPLAVTGALFTLKLAGSTINRLQPDRHDPADRPGHQELDPAGGVHQPAQGARAGHGGRRRSRPAASGSGRS